MLVIPWAYRSLGGAVGWCLLLGLLVWGCAMQESPPPPQATTEVRRQLTILEECIERSQQAVRAAVGVSAGSLAPANSGIADAQDAVEAVQHFLRQGKAPEALQRASIGTVECDKITAMVTKGQQEARQRQAQAQLVMEADRQITALLVCLEASRELLQRGTASRATPEALATLRSPLESAEAALQQARASLAQDNPQQALGRLNLAAADCQASRVAGDKLVEKLAQEKSRSFKARRKR